MILSEWLKLASFRDLKQIMKYLVLISCSDKKRDGGRPYLPGADPTPWLTNPELRRRLFDTRTRVFELIKENQLVDSEKRQGPRGRDPRNATLVKGPEFGGSADGVCLPACLRYHGRFFRTIAGQSSEDEVVRKWKGLQTGCHVLIVSGLYGLVAPFDPIQEYTCHFADRILGQDTSLQLLWRDLLTEILRIQATEEPFLLMDLLSEEAYEDAFDWHSIYKSMKCLHRAYKLKAGPETLINSALFFNELFLSEKETEPLILTDRFISKDYFDDSHEKILFEPELKTTRKEVAREGILEALPALKKQYGSAWDLIPITVRNQLANSEYFFMRNRDLPNFDFTSASICLSKALEIWLEVTVVAPLVNLSEFDQLLTNPSGRRISPHRATIGDVARFLSRVRNKMGEGWTRVEMAGVFPLIGPQHLKDLSDELGEIAPAYRNGWVHKDSMPRTFYEQFREREVEFFSKWASLWKKAK